MPELLLGTTPGEEDDLPHQSRKGLTDGNHAGQKTDEQRQRYEQVYDIDEIITRMPTPDEVARLAYRPGFRLPSTSEPVSRLPTSPSG